MQRLLLLLLVCLTPFVFSADNNLYKNCSRVPFCTTMRYQEVNKFFYFSADIMSYAVTDNVVTVPLSNLNGDELDLQISVLSGRKARVKVLEKNHSRYELQDVLDKDFPAISTVHATTEERMLFLISQEDTNFIIHVNGPAPFSVEFLYDTQVELVLRGDRLVMTNNDSSQAFSFDVEFEEAQKLYGLHHHAYNLGLGETADGTVDPFHLKNFDTPSYDVGSTMALYGAVPVVYGHSSKWTSGVFLHNAAQQWIDITYAESNPIAYFMVESGTFDLFVMMGRTPKEIVRQFTDLTGKAHMPQLWALGYHQCRYSYMTQEEVKNVVAYMDQGDFPMDAIWLDIDYTDEKKYFTWNKETFTDPEEMQRNLSSTNRKLVTIIDPHYKVDDNYPVYAGAKDDLFVKWPNGSNFEGNCWPGLASWFDFLNPEARDYYASWFSYEKFVGSTEVLAGIWNDMNEPSIFDAQFENTMPSETVHIGDVLHRDVHNIYGFLQTKATHQGLIQRDNGTKRPFILTRSHFAGSQRYAAMWTGDNLARWSHLPITYPECVNSNMLGLVFCGADVGGFNENPTEQLIQRWYQAAIWLPFFRQHSASNAERREPYLFSEEIQNVIRNAIKLRYKHLPVWYTLFYEHTRYGDPILRPFFYEYPEFFEQDDHVLVGSDILARPVLEPDVTSITVIFPGSNTNWYRADDESWSVHKGNTSEEVDVDISTSPYYYRAGSIIPRKDRARKSSTDMQNDPLTIYVNLDENGNAQGRYYQDDYESFKYSTDDIYLYATFTYIPASHGIQILIIDGNSEGFAPVLQEIVVHSITEVSGKAAGVQSRYTTNSEGIPLSSIDIVAQLKKMRSNEMMIFL
ncbi:neutral alpha-glucosidase C isoform X1 [Anoplophora glabripennis]|uniref:neutral alpha-glucosidase C isoform X1 n=1 Tax=Anoplophora glabripennis TaxID=217634 RepID=UPI0008742826|nr:neutral alpha-glucosidase C isoform X1 [Anoplophora glabripennis]